MQKENIITMGVNYSSKDEVVNHLTNLAHQRISAYVCVSNVHMCMEVYDSKEFALVVNSADLTIPDGRPLAWMLYLLGHKESCQIRGTDLFHALCTNAQQENLKIALFGGKEATLKKLKEILVQKYPKIQISYSYSPPFRSLTQDEKNDIIQKINDSGANLLFVGLGCPKQEIWMAENRGKVSAVMVGVGAAFDFISGEKGEAPRWMQRVGLEWFFRLLVEPKRLFWRYFKTNPRFVLLATRQLFRHFF